MQGQKSTNQGDARGRKGDEGALYRRTPDDHGLQGDAREATGGKLKISMNRENYQNNCILAAKYSENPEKERKTDANAT